MRSRRLNNIQLGIFVLTGLVFLVLGLYFVGKKRTIFSSNLELKAHFKNVQGLKKGANVRYAGIDVGTVTSIAILNDSIVEVTMSVQQDMKGIVRKDALASVGTDGFVGNKLVNLKPSAGSSTAFIANGDVLRSEAQIGTEEMMRTMSRTGNDVAELAENLKLTVQRLNTSTAIWTLLNDNTLPEHIRASLLNVQATTQKADQFVGALNQIMSDVQKGKGPLGALVKDSSMVRELEIALVKIRQAGEQAEAVGRDVRVLVGNVSNEIDNGDGIVNAALKDTSMVRKVNRSLDNIEQATEALNQNMEALKHNFLFRGYFRRLEKQKQND